MTLLWPQGVPVGIFTASVGVCVEQRRPSHYRPDLTGSAPSVGHAEVVTLQFINTLTLTCLLLRQLTNIG